MADIVPTLITQGSLGDFKLSIATFATADVDSGATWPSGIEGIVARWTHTTDKAATAANTACDTTLSGSTFTFEPGEDNQAVTLFVISRS